MARTVMVGALVVCAVGCGGPVGSAEDRLAGDDVAAVEGALSAPKSVTRSGTVEKLAWVELEAIDAKPGTDVSVIMTGDGDPDLYVDFRGAPTETRFSCSPQVSGANETCNKKVPGFAKGLFIAVRGFEAGSFSVTVRYTPAGEDAPVEQDFTYYVVRKASLIRDGGSILVDGYINRSVDARIRYDGALGSPTRGQIYVTLQEMFQAAQPERLMTANERAQLKIALVREAGSTPDLAIKQLIERL
ncbi:MAG: hypothetical protein ACT4TC_23105 [Myxococcaceae bacterium]